MRCQTYGYLPSRGASPILEWYQIILIVHCWQRHTSANNLPKVAAWKRNSRWSNPLPLSRKSIALTTTPPDHEYKSTGINNLCWLTLHCHCQSVLLWSLARRKFCEKNVNTQVEVYSSGIQNATECRTQRNGVRVVLCLWQTHRWTAQNTWTAGDFMWFQRWRSRRGHFGWKTCLASTVRRNVHSLTALWIRWGWQTSQRTLP